MLLRAIFDNILLNAHGNKRLRAEYYKFKFVDSDDFTDLKEGLIPVKKEREAQINAKSGGRLDE